MNTQNPLDTQRIIVHQSMIKFTNDYARQLGVNLNLKETIRITNILTDYCVFGYSDELGSKLDSVDNWILKKFSEE